MKARPYKMVAALAALALLGCGEDAPAAAAAAPAKRPASAAPKVEAETAAVVAPYVYQYSPLNKRDPFRSPLAEARAAGGAGTNEQCPDPLCQFDLDQLKLVAVVTGDANPIAMVEDPQGRGYIVRRNTRMGKQGGKVTQILRDSVTVTEYWQGPDGKINPNPAVMKLKDDERGSPALDLFTGQVVR